MREFMQSLRRALLTLLKALVPTSNLKPCKIKVLPPDEGYHRVRRR